MTKRFQAVMPAVLRPCVLVAFAGMELHSSAVAQSPSFSYKIRSEPRFLWQPGVTATFTVFCSFTPDIGEMVNTPLGPRPVLGLSSGEFDIVGTSPLPLWSGLGLVAPYNSPGNSPGSPSGSSVGGVSWSNGAGPPLGAVSTINPTPLWVATLVHPAQNVVLNLVPSGPHTLWAGFPGEQAIEVPAVQVTGGSWQSMQFCYADCTGDGMLTVADFGCFQTRFVKGSMYADCNGDGMLSVADFGCFQSVYVWCCP